MVDTITIDETQPRSFTRFADEIGMAERLTVALAAAWARSSNTQIAHLGTPH